jgi:dienelactone hydrolase
LRNPVIGLRLLTCVAMVFALWPLGALSAFAQDKTNEPPKLAEDIHETISKVPVTVTLPSGKKYTGQMVLTHYRPDGEGPFPIVIFNHGRSGKKEERAAMPRFRQIGIARYFVRRGFAVFVPTRLGYGDSNVDIDPEVPRGGCSQGPDYRPAMRAMLVQTLATAKFAKTLPWTDGSRVVVAGQLYGGFAAIGASANKELGALGAINFVGGAGGLRKKPGQPCGPLEIGAAIADAGKQAKVPMLWLYAENDSLWGSDLPRKWHAAYVNAGGKAEMVMFPAIDEDGHFVIGHLRLWRPVADRFLETIGFPPPHSADAPSATDFARLDEADKVPYVKENAKSGYQKFLNADLPRAFVVSTKGGWAWRSGENATERALQSCREKSTSTCHLYAVDDAVVFKPPVSAEATPAQ